jgi:hypothetical protein
LIVKQSDRRLSGNFGFIRAPKERTAGSATGKKARRDFLQKPAVPRARHFAEKKSKLLQMPWVSLLERLCY